MSLMFGVVGTQDGFVVCVLQEDGKPAMLLSPPFEDEGNAVQLQRILQVSEENHMAAKVVDALHRVGVVEPSHWLESRI